MMCFSDVFPFSLHRVQEFLQDILIPLLSSVNVIIYTKKASGLMKSSKQ